MIPGLGRFPQGRKCQPFPVFVLGEFHGQRSLVGYHPRGCKDLDMTERLTHLLYNIVLGFPGGSVVKNLLPMQETQVGSWVENIPWRRKWQPAPAFLPGKSHGQRSLASYSPRGHKESDTTG